MYSSLIVSVRLSQNLLANLPRLWDKLVKNRPVKKLILAFFEVILQVWKKNHKYSSDGILWNIAKVLFIKLIVFFKEIKCKNYINFLKTQCNKRKIKNFNLFYRKLYIVHSWSVKYTMSRNYSSVMNMTIYLHTHIRDGKKYYTRDVWPTLTYPPLYAFFRHIW